jgi:fructokinase
VILVCGEALVDLFLGEPDGAQMPARAVVGGSPFNVAIGLARLGVPAGFLGGISRDRFGDWLAERLQSEGVDGRLLLRSDRPSTLSIVATTADGQPSYSFHGEGAADRWIAAEAMPAALPAEVAALSFGSYSMAVEPAGSSFAALAQREHGRRVISVDPNLRPGIIGDMALWERAAERFFRRATIVKASDEDVRTAWNGRVSLQDAATAWLERGASLVVITRGAQGAIGFSAAGQIAVPGRQASLLDTVGAGDSFHAALLARLFETGRLSLTAIAALDLTQIAELIAYANAAAAITVGRRGADLPTAAEVSASSSQG